MPHISIHTLQLKVLDIIMNCLSNWSNPKLNITIESQKTEHASMVFIHMKHKSSSTCFFLNQPLEFQHIDLRIC